MASSDLRGRTSAHDTGRPTSIGSWQIGAAPGGEGRARTTPLTAHVGQTSVSPTRGRLPASINSVVTGRPWASAGSSCFMAGTPLFFAWWSNATANRRLGSTLSLINFDLADWAARSRPTVPGSDRPSAPHGVNALIEITPGRNRGWSEFAQQPGGQRTPRRGIGHVGRARHCPASRMPSGYHGVPSHSAPSACVRMSAEGPGPLSPRIGHLYVLHATPPGLR